MSNFVEIDVDFGYCGEVEMVLAHDEGGEHEDVEFYRDGLLAEDNAKLRGLCEYLWGFAKTCGADHPFLRELGVEVPEQ